MVAMNLEPMVTTVVGTMILKSSSRIMLKMNVICILWITKTNKADWKAPMTSDYSRSSSSATLMFRHLKAITYVSFGVSRMMGATGAGFGFWTS